MKSAWRTVKRKPDKLEIPRKTRGIFAAVFTAPARSGPPRWGKSPFFGTGPGGGVVLPGEHRDGLHALLAAGVQESLQQLPGHALAAAAGADVQLRHLGGGPRVAGGALQQPAEEARRLPGHKGQQHPLGPGWAKAKAASWGEATPSPLKARFSAKNTWASWAVAPRICTAVSMGFPPRKKGAASVTAPLCFLANFRLSLSRFSRR